MSTVELVLFFLGIFVVGIALNVFSHLTERRDARAAVREIEALRRIFELKFAPPARAPVDPDLVQPTDRNPAFFSTECFLMRNFFSLQERKI